MPKIVETLPDILQNIYEACWERQILTASHGSKLGRDIFHLEKLGIIYANEMNYRLESLTAYLHCMG